MARTFDEDQLLQRVDHDLSFLGETVQMLESDGRALMKSVKSALAAGKASDVGQHGHALKGMISNFCAAEAHAIAAEIERAGKAGDCAGASSAAIRLEPSLESLIAELRAFVKAKP